MSLSITYLAQEHTKKKYKKTYDMVPNSEKACASFSSLISAARSPTNTWKWLVVSSFVICKGGLILAEGWAQFALISYTWFVYKFSTIVTYALYIVENLSTIHILDSLFSNSWISKFNKSIIDSTLSIDKLICFSFFHHPYKIVMFSNLFY